MRVSPRQGRLSADLFTVIVAASVGIALAGFTWRLLGYSAGEPAKLLVSAHATKPVDLAPLIALDLFAEGRDPNARPESGGQLTLRGVLLTQPRSSSTALISIGDAPAIAVAVGQSAGTATITAIAIDHVELASGGARTTLAFPKSGAVIGATASAAPTPGQPPAPIAIPSEGLAALGNLGIIPSGSGIAVANPSTAMRTAGMQQGDQIVAINGVPARDLAQNPSSLQPILAAGTAQLQVIRAGQRFSLSVPLR